jgi:hypothetical protein
LLDRSAGFRKKARFCSGDAVDETLAVNVSGQHHFVPVLPAGTVQIACAGAGTKDGGTSSNVVIGQESSHPT